MDRIIGKFLPLPLTKIITEYDYDDYRFAETKCMMMDLNKELSVHKISEYVYKLSNPNKNQECKCFVKGIDGFDYDNSILTIMVPTHREITICIHGTYHAYQHGTDYEGTFDVIDRMIPTDGDINGNCANDEDIAVWIWGKFIKKPDTEYVFMSPVDRLIAGLDTVD